MSRPVAKKFIAPGVPRHSRSTVYKRKKLYKRTFKDVKPATKEIKSIVQRELKGGNKRDVPVSKAARWYTADDAPKPKISRKTPKPTKLRSSITPGTVLILLAGRFRGKRVVFLKQLENGLLLVTGPYSVNGVPIKRVNQAYVIATSTKLELDHDLSKYNDAYFKKSSTSKKNKPTEEEFFEQQKAKKANYPGERKTDQKELDGVVLKAIKKVEHLEHYLNSNFSLKKGQYLHEMNF